MSRTRTRLERLERLARDHLPHAGALLVTTWRKMPEAELAVLARLGDGPAMKAADMTADRLWPATAEYHAALTRTCAQLEPLPVTDARWYRPLPQPSDAAIREAIDVLDSSAPPEGEHDAWMLARLSARITVAVRDG